MHQAIGAEFEDLDARSDTEAEIIGRNLEIVDLAEAWCKAVRARALEYVQAGGDIPGWALAEGRKGARKWEDESIAREQLINVLGDRAFEKMLISPAKAEKLLKNTPPWETLKELIIQEPGKPALKRMEG